MTSIQFSRAAFQAFHSEPFLVIVTDSIFEAVLPLFPAPVRLLRLTSAGNILTAEDVSDNDDASIPFQGISAGLKLVAYSQNYRSIAGLLIEDIEKSSPNRHVDAVEVGRQFGIFRRRRLIPLALKVYAEALDFQKKISSQSEQALVDLRRKNDWLTLNLEKARRMIRGIGYDTKYLTVEVPVGKKDIGPNGMIVAWAFKQRLPCDVLGLAAVSLYFQKPAISGVGDILIQVSREADGYILKEASVSFAEVVSGGWHTVFMGDPIDLAFGDAILWVRWRSDSSRACPSIVLSDMECAQFGDTHQRSAALRIYKGLTDPISVRRQVMRLRQTHRRAIPLTDLLGSAREVCLPADDQATSQEAIRKIMSHELKEGWLQTHSMGRNIAGVEVDGLLDGYSCSLAATISVAHASASDHTFLMLAVSRASELMEKKALLEFCQEIVFGIHGTVKRAEQRGDVIWATESLKAGASARIEITANTPFLSNAKIYLLTATKGHSDYGWCRWERLEVQDETFFDAEELVSSKTALQALPRVYQRLTTYRFTELRGKLSYLDGSSELSRQAKVLGFSPMLVSEDAGYLQVHPLLDTISGSFVRDIVPARSVSVSCEVETAHDSAPDFRYLLIASMAPSQISLASIREFIKELPSPENTIDLGFDPELEIYWASHVIGPGRSHNIHIEFDKPTDAVGDLFFVTLPLEGSINFGWCRWNALHFSTLLPSNLAAEER